MPSGVSSASLSLKAVFGATPSRSVGWATHFALHVSGLRAVVARPDHRRKHELVVARLRHQEFGVAQLHLDVVARQDVGDVHLEHVGQVLLEQRGGLAFLLRGVVVDARLLLLADLRGDQAVGQAHVETADRGLGRAGEHVLRLDRSRALVAVGLRDPDVGDHARHLHVDFRALERQAVDRRVVALDEEVGALGREARAGCFLRMQRPRDEQQAATACETQCREPEPAAGTGGGGFHGGGPVVVQRCTAATVERGREASSKPVRSERRCVKSV